MATVDDRVHDLETCVHELQCREATNIEVIRKNSEILEEVKQWMSTTGSSIFSCQKEQAVYCRRVETLESNQNAMSARIWAVSLVIITIVLGAVFANKAVGAVLPTSTQEMQMFGIDIDVIKDVLAIAALILPWLCLKIPQLSWFDTNVLKLLGGNTVIFAIIAKANELAALDSDDARMNYVAKELQAIYEQKTGLKLSDTSARLIVQWVYRIWKKKFK